MIFVGMDGGGTKTALLARTAPDAPLLERTGPGVNPQRFGVEEACVRLSALLREVRDALAPDAPMRVFAGLSGAGRADDQARISATVTADLGGDVRVHITHDADIALDAAFPDASGAIVIAGTGSVILARTRDGVRCRVGGWGYLLGDEGSGTALGLEALRAVCRALDGGPATRLVQLAADRHELGTRSALIEQVYHTRWPYQHGAAMVLDAAHEGDAVARAIVAQQTDALARQLGYLPRAYPDVEPRYTLLGGLCSEPIYRAALTAAIGLHAPGWAESEPPLSPTEAALHCAEAFDW